MFWGRPGICFWVGDILMKNAVLGSLQLQTLFSTKDFALFYRQIQSLFLIKKIVLILKRSACPRYPKTKLPASAIYEIWLQIKLKTNINKKVEIKKEKSKLATALKIKINLLQKLNIFVLQRDYIQQMY
jgi:hypothetical protein